VCAATESCIRLFDVDEDGKLDIIFSVGRLQNLSMTQLFDGNGSQPAIEGLCKKFGKFFVKLRPGHDVKLHPHRMMSRT